LIFMPAEPRTGAQLYIRLLGTMRKNARQKSVLRLLRRRDAPPTRQWHPRIWFELSQGWNVAEDAAQDRLGHMRRGGPTVKQLRSGRYCHTRLLGDSDCSAVVGDNRPDPALCDAQAHGFAGGTENRSVMDVTLDLGLVRRGTTLENAVRKQRRQLPGGANDVVQETLMDAHQQRGTFAAKRADFKRLALNQAKPAAAGRAIF